MAVTLTNRYGGTSTPTLTTGSDDCDYVLVVGGSSVERYTKTGATSYQFAYETQGLGGMTAGHVIGVTYVEGGTGGSGASNFDDLLDYSPTTPAEGDLIVVGPGGAGVTNSANALTELDANEFLCGVGVGQPPVAKTVAQMQALLGVDKVAIAYTDSAPVDGTVEVLVRAPFAFTIDSFTVDLDSGTVTIAVKINGTNVTGLSAVSASSTKATTNGTAANTVAVGDVIALAFSSASTPVGLRATINGTRG